MAGAGYRRMLERLDAARAEGVVLGLERVRAALAHLGLSPPPFVAVQIAGSNGKGSTAAMTEAILRAAGLRTGLFTSPHLCRFTERVRIDGREVDPERLAALAEAVLAAPARLTYFELATLLAVRAFADAAIDVAVMETGLGGRLDAVTAVPAAAAAITSVSLEHTDVLGDTLSAVATEKAHVARAGRPLFVGDVPAEAAAAIARVAAAARAELRGPAARADLPVTLALAGEHQRGNAALAVALARAAGAALGRELPPSAIARGLAGTVWPGRLEWLAPDVLLDGAHNPDGAATLVRALPPRRPRALVVSVVRGKDVPGIVRALAPAFDRVFATASANPRALPAEELASVFRSVAPDLPASVVPGAGAALTAARGFGGLAVVAGSLFLVGEVRAAWLDEPTDPVPTGDPMP